MHDRTENRRDALLPPPELLRRYEEISKGLSKDLVKIVKEEQDHRHRLQKKYLMHYRLGQLIGTGCIVYTLIKIFELIKEGKENPAYVMAGIFAVLILLALKQYRYDKVGSQRRRSDRQPQRRHHEGRREGGDSRRRPPHRSRRQGGDYRRRERRG